jgi:predicted aspartyl protease
VIRGAVSADGVPMIILSIAGQDWPAIIDTGFNGDLELPNDLRDVFNARYVGRVISALAGGQSVQEDVYLVEIEAVKDFCHSGHIVNRVGSS